LLREQGDVTESACAGDESGAGYVQGQGCGAGGGVDLLGKYVGSGEAQEAFDSAQFGFLVGALDGGYPVVDDAAVDFVEGRVVVDVPAQCDDVLGGSPPQQDAAFVGIQAESDRVGCHVVAVHADRVATEAAPVVELVRFDYGVAQVDIAEQISGHRVSLNSLKGFRV